MKKQKQQKTQSPKRKENGGTDAFGSRRSGWPHKVIMFLTRTKEPVTMREIRASVKSPNTHYDLLNSLQKKHLLTRKNGTFFLTEKGLKMFLAK